MELRKLTYSNVDEVLALTVREEQKEFVASNEYSLVDAYIALSNGGCAQPFGIYEGEEPVGFVMFGYGTLDDSDEPQIAAGNYCLWRFMIEQKHQGRGLGKKALQACTIFKPGLWVRRSIAGSAMSRKMRLRNPCTRSSALLRTARCAGKKLWLCGNYSQNARFAL